MIWTLKFMLLLTPLLATDLAAEQEERVSWIVDAETDHIAYVRMMGDLWSVNRSAELRIAYKQRITADGADVMVASVDVSCPDLRTMATGNIAFQSGELWMRKPALLLGELTSGQFEALKGDGFLEATRKVVCWTPSFRERQLWYVKQKDRLFTQTYFALVDLGLEVRSAIICAGIPRNFPLAKGWLQQAVKYESRDAVLTVLRERDQLPMVEKQAAP